MNPLIRPKQNKTKQNKTVIRFHGLCWGASTTFYTYLHQNIHYTRLSYYYNRKRQGSQFQGSFKFTDFSLTTDYPDRCSWKNAYTIVPRVRQRFITLQCRAWFICGKLSRYHRGWWPGTLHCQAINMQPWHWLQYIHRHIGPFIPWRRISTTCAISVWWNVIKCKYIFMLSHKCSSRKGVAYPHV